MNIIKKTYDAVVVGAGPNGLASAVRLAQMGKSVLVLEAAPTVGGGTRSAELTLPDFTHDICSAIHPMTVASPFLRSLPLEQYGLQWVYPAAPLAAPLDGGTAVVQERSVQATAAQLGRDARVYQAFMSPLVRNAHKLLPMILGPLPVPRHPLLLARFGALALWPATTLGKTVLREERTRTFFAGHANHAIVPLEQLATSAVGLVLMMLGHTTGWPFPRGGAQHIADALAAYLRDLGVEIVTNARIESYDQLPPHRAALFDLTPRQLLQIAGDQLSPGYRRGLERFRYGPGVFKVDYALDGPVPWQAPQCLRAGTVHIGGSLDEIALSERQAARGETSEQPYVLLAQHSLFDQTRAPEGKHTLWAYCHVPHGSTVDMTSRIEAQIERFAPGFKNRIIGRTTTNSQGMEAYNANYIGGDINGGVQDIWQLFTRPVPKLNPYITSDPNIYLCSSSTPPGGGVHGMCGYHAANAALGHSLKD